MLGLRVALKEAEKAKEFLKANSLLAPGALAFRENEFFYLPLSQRPSGKLPFASETVSKRFKQSQQKSFKQLLLDKRLLNESELTQLVTSFDVIGDIAVIEIPRALRRKEKAIAQCLLESLAPRVKTVAKRAGITEGKYRVRKITVLAGEKKTTATHKENNCLYAVDLNRVYFSPRLAFERSRIASLVRPRERVLVLFAGVGPYAIAIAKAQPSAQVIAVELNPVAVRYLRENIALNKARNAEAVEGDAKRVLARKRFLRWANSIVMPLPKEGKKFLVAAIKAARSGGVIHYYALASLDSGLRGPSEKQADVFAQAKEDARKACEKAGRKCVVLNARKVIPFAPRVAQIVVDFSAR